MSDEDAKQESTGLELDLRKIDLLEDIENRAPDSKEIWYGHSILTSTLLPPLPPPKSPHDKSKNNRTNQNLH